MNQVFYFILFTVLFNYNIDEIEAISGRLCSPYDLVCLSAPNLSKVPKIIIEAFIPLKPNYEVKTKEKLVQIEPPNKPVECKPKTGKCHTTSECFLQYGEKDFALCTRPDGAQGVCCMIQDNKPPTDGYYPPVEPKPDPYPTPVPELSASVVSAAVNTAGKAAMEYVEKIDKLEYELSEKKLVPLPGSQEFSHQSFFGRNPDAVKLARNGLINLQTAIGLAKSFRWSPSQSRTGFAKVDLSKSPVKNICPKEPTCPPSKYRSADGTCNNQNNKSWGKTMSAFNRLLSPSYADGFDKPRVASDGSQLPGAREVSLILAPDKHKPNPRYTLLVMQFGQFLDHDLTRTAGTRTNDNKEIQCCGEAFEQNPNLLHPACMPITIPPIDDFSRKLGKTCMSFIRSAAAPRAQCKLGAREQLNQLSAYIDSENIYGSSQEQLMSLRLLKGGRLKTSVVDNREFLPFSNSSAGCSIPSNLQLKCFAAGDGRINEHTDLAVMHGVWLKEHNRIAGTLSKLNPEWDDETLYQETRRIVIAEIQHIVYNEFLPIIIGRKTMRGNRLFLVRKGFSDRYSPDTDAGILSGFATAAYRFHSLIPGVFDLQSSDNRVLDRVQLRDQFFDPQLLYRRGGLEMLINGLTGQPMQRGDNFFTKDVTNHLFQQKGESSGLDLVALNTQRGRDHGLPGYNEWRELCRLPRINNFEELETVFENPSVARGMRSLYRSVDDIDLFMAGVSEKHISDAIVGPTFACIIGEQFRRIKEGDRFWFENGGMESSFTLQQLNEIRKSSFSRVLCDNSDVKVMQPLAMVQTFNWNPKLSCIGNEIPRLDLTFWSTKKVNGDNDGSYGKPNNKPDKQPENEINENSYG